MARSRSGCWTCRLKTKKKCDETRPICRRCTALQVRCFGYGPQPTEDELGDVRKARIARIEVLGGRGNEESSFMVWRPKQRRASCRKLVDEEDDGPATARVRERSLTALDRVNSDMLDFLHPHLLNNYTQKVFWLDSRFYQAPAPHAGNSWLVPFLNRSEMLRLAAALMGLTWETFQSDPSRLTNVEFTRPMVTLHSLVIRSVQQEVERSKRLPTADKLTVAANLAQSATILLIFEVWRTVEGDWIPHLNGMANILQWTRENAPAAINDIINMRSEDDATVTYDTAPTALATNATLNRLALRWFLQSYVWNDITASVWVGTRYSCTRCHEFYPAALEMGSLQMDKFMGCEDMVLFLISRISMLEEVLVNESEQGSDHATWHQEALHIDQALHARLKHNLIIRDEHPINSHTRDATYITEMWTHAALIYLHIVTTGSYSNHPKLRRLVTRGVRAYENMPRRLDIHTAMPFGVLASMATESELQVLLEIAEQERRVEEINPGQRKTLGIVKECCKLRRPAESAFLGGVNWRHGAESLGLVILPV